MAGQENRGRTTGTPQGKYPDEPHLTPDTGAAGRKTGAPRGTYPGEDQLAVRDGAAPKMSEAGDPKDASTATVPLVEPKPTRATDRANLSNPF